MHKDYSSLPRNSRWRAETNINSFSIPNSIRALVLDKGSLTAALVELSNDNFRVNLLSQGIGLPFWHEQRKLLRPQHRGGIIREVELLIHGEPVVYARSIIPLALRAKGRRGLADLGSRPLGQLLFQDGRIRVSKREFSVIESEPSQIYARRTPYDYLGSQILVSEFFLPALEKYLPA